jgi:hypothetical protein
MQLFSQRHAKPHERYTYILPDKVRMRILQSLKQLNAGYMSSHHYDFATMLGQVGQELLSRFGSLNPPLRRGPFEQNVLDHFAGASDEQALDFIQLCFRTEALWVGSPEASLAVEKINTIFEEEGIGYELTPPNMVETGESAKLLGRSSRARCVRHEYPRIIKKGEATVHEQAVEPALEVLRDSRFETANSELLDAFEKVRKGDYPAGITSCGKAFESVLKTICAVKGWAYDPEKDTCAKLVGICRDQGLFFPFYALIFEGVGTVRNKLGAHGGGPKPAHVAIPWPKRVHRVAQA